MSSLYHQKKTWRIAESEIAERAKRYRKLILQQERILKPSSEQKRQFQALRGDRPIGGPLRLGDLPARKMFAMLVAKEIHRLWRADPNLEFTFLTLLADEGITSDRRPAAYIETLITKARRALRKLDVNGIAVVEVAPLTNHPQKGCGRTLLFHVHVLIWHRRGYDPTPRIEELNPSRGIRPWTCKFGAPAVDWTEITRAMGSPSYWAGYMLKPPHDAKKVDQSTDEDGRIRVTMRDVTNGYRPELAMRLQEFFSQVPLTSMSIGTRGGGHILNRARKQLKRWAKQRQYRYLKPVRPFDEKAFWKWTHRRRKKRYFPFFIEGETIY